MEIDLPKSVKCLGTTALSKEIGEEPRLSGYRTICPEENEAFIKGKQIILAKSSNYPYLECNQQEIAEDFLGTEVKDRGYAWMVLAAMFFSNMLTTGYVKGFGLISNEMLEIYPQTSVTMIGLMMGLLIGCRSIFAPMAGALGQMIGIRSSLFIGSFICVTALIASFFCDSVSQFAITLGAMSGIGQCIIESCQVIIVSTYFDNSLSWANGIRVSGNPFGGVVFSLTLALLFDYYGFKLSFIMLAGVMLHLFVFSSLIRPFDLHLRIRANEFVRNLPPNCAAYHDEDIQKAQKEKVFREIMAQYFVTAASRNKKRLEFSYLKEPVYLLFVFMAAWIPMGLPLVYYYSTIYAKKILRLSTYEISLFISVQSFIDIFMRLFIGWLNNKKIYKMAHGYIFCLFLSGLGSMFIPLTTGFWSLLGALFVFSFGPNSYHTFVTVILTSQFGRESIASTWGFVRMTQGIFSFIHPTLIGYVVDASGSYTAAFIVTGIGMVIAGFAIFLEPFVVKMTNSNIAIT